ncbi:MAG TPA: restriction endonuclease, SacI family [Candidatus Bathyarchaeia archaeon]
MNEGSSVDVEEKKARELLQTEWNHVVKYSNQDFLDSAKYPKWTQRIKAVIHGKQLTYRYILLTAVLAKAVNPNIHYRALQQGSKLQGAYDARSIAHSVVVPFEKSHGERFGGSNEPFLNRPARYPEFDLSNRDRNRAAQRQLYGLLEDCQNYSAKDKTLATAVLRQVLKEMFFLSPTKKEFQLPPIKISLHIIMKMVVDFLAVSGSGERLVAICAATFASMEKALGGRSHVKAYPVNWPDKFAKTAGDIEFYLDGKIVKAAESKDKPISISDVRHCQMKAKRHGITEYIILNGARIVAGDKLNIDKFIESQLQEGINLYLLDVPTGLFPYLLYLGEQGRTLFLTEVGNYLNEIKATRENKEAWQQLIDKYLSK